MTVGVIREAIVISENIDSYAWVLKKMAEMEPRFKLEDKKIIFGDQGVTQKLLESLGIDDSCLLHGDYHHLTYEVWPQVESFGSLVWHSNL